MFIQLRLWQSLGSWTDSSPWALSTCAPVYPSPPPCAISVLNGAKPLQAGSTAVSVAPPLTCLRSCKSCLILELSLGDIFLLSYRSYRVCEKYHQQEAIADPEMMMVKLNYFILAGPVVCRLAEAQVASLLVNSY